LKKQIFSGFLVVVSPFSNTTATMFKSVITPETTSQPNQTLTFLRDGTVFDKFKLTHFSKSKFIE